MTPESLIQTFSRSISSVSNWMRLRCCAIAAAQQEDVLDPLSEGWRSWRCRLVKPAQVVATV